MSFCLALLLFRGGLVAQTITKGPYLGTPQDRTVVIRWESDQTADYSVFYSRNKSLNKSAPATLAADTHGRYLYEVKIENLKPGKKYHYKVVAGSTSSPVDVFKVAPNKSPTRFVVMGDSRTHPDIFKAISDQVDALAPDLILSTGDLVGSGGNFDEWQKYYFGVAGDVIDHIPLVSALGDHEGHSDDGRLFAHFFMPRRDHQKLWFSFDYGDAHFVALDYRYPDSEEMIEWFENDMAASQAKWTFVYLHRPLYNFGGHRSYWSDGRWQALMHRYKVDMVFAGHSHLYERFYPTRPLSQPDAWPVTYITTGGAGAPLYRAGESSALAMTKSVNHFVHISLDGDRLELKALLPDGSLLDHLVLQKKEAGYDDHYMSLVVPEENMELHAMFAKEISQHLKSIPLKKKPALLHLNLAAKLCAQDVSFEIALTDSAQKSYIMEPVRGAIKHGEPFTGVLKIYPKQSMTISRWGDIEPEIMLTATYKTDLFEETIVGKALWYPDY